MRFISSFMRVIFVALLFLAPSLAQAQETSFSEATKLFSEDSFSSTEKAIQMVATAKSPRALSILEALRDGRLIAGGGDVVVVGGDGVVVSVRDGGAVTKPDNGAPVRLNNRLRNALNAAMGSMTLLATDPEKRLAAAQSVFRSKDQSLRSALAVALSSEANSTVKAAMSQALALLTLNGSSASSSETIGAIETLRQRGDQDALAALRAASLSLDDPASRSAAASAADSIESRMKVSAVFQTVWYGLSLGSVLLLAAIGLSITFGVMGVINMAHGEMVMLGAYATFVTQQAIQAYVPWLMAWSLAISLPVAFFVAAAAGLVIEMVVIRRLYGRPLETLLATFGVSLILQQAIRSAFGPTNREVTTPAFMSGAFDLYGISVGYGRMWILVFTLIVFASLLALLRATSLGLRMRAVTQNRRMAAAMGIRTSLVDAATFALGSGVAGVAGVALSQIDNVSPNLGQSYIIDSFMVVVFGGVGNLWGTLVSALALGVGSKVLEPMVGAVLAKIFILIGLILFIQKKPAGLFALKGRAVES